MASSSKGAEEKTEPQVDLNDVFSLRKPKDAKAGVASGLKSIGKGIAAGVAGLVAGPVVGASQQGVVGAAKGLAAGVVGAVVLPVTGVTVGTVQMVRGVVNTPEAMSEAKKGKIWDQEKRAWVPKPDGTIITADAAKQSTKDVPRKPTQGVDYYEVLMVERDATGEQIKKAYYVLARKWHPDKNPGDETAHARFQLLSEAYQVLGNEELRARYDAHGSEGLDVNFMDSSEFFAMLFGSDLFEHLVGELAIAAAARMGGENLSAAQMKAAQTVRVEKLAVNLKAVLQRHVAGDIEGFKLAMEQEAVQLVTASFGQTMLHTIGGVYAQQADIYLGNMFSSLAAKMKASTDNMKSQINAASAAIKVYQAHQRIEQWQKDQERLAAVEEQAAGTSRAPGQPTTGTPGPAAAGEEASDGEEDGEAGAARKAQRERDIAAARAALEEAALPLMLEAMWAANVLDIQTTLRKVCLKVLSEPGVSSADLKARALALRELGVIFKAAQAPATGADAGPAGPSSAAPAKAGKAGAAPAPTPQDAKRQMEEAMIKVMEKRQGGADGHAE